MTEKDASPEPVVAVLIPAHNEARTIRGVVSAALAHAGWVIVIDDGSTDGTLEALDGLPVEMLRRQENAGKGPRLEEGIAHAVSRGAESILTLDADGQHDPEDIPAFLEAARQDPNALILGDRMTDRGDMPAHRAFSIAIGDFVISWAIARRIRDCQCGMRVYPARTHYEIQLSDADKQKFAFETAILLYLAEIGVPFRRVAIEARYAGYQIRPSHFRPGMDTLLIARAITVFLARRFFRPKGLLIALGLVR